MTYIISLIELGFQLRNYLTYSKFLESTNLRHIYVEVASQALGRKLHRTVTVT